MSGDGYHGFFVSLDQTTDDLTGEQTRLLRCFACASADSTGVGLIELPLEEGKTLMDEIIPATVRAANLAQISLKDAEPFFQIYLLKMFTIITRLCQLILYITAQNADVRELNRPGKKGRLPAGPRELRPVGD